MSEHHNRRELVGSALAGAAAIGAALTEIRSTGAAPAETETHARTQFRGKLTSLDIRPHPNGENGWYRAIVVLKHNGGDLRTKGTESEVHDLRLYKMLHRQDGRVLHGQISLRLDKINYRLMGAEFDRKSHTWTLDLKLCLTNPDADPLRWTPSERTGGGNYRLRDEASGCNCTCGTSCWHCERPYAPGYVVKCGQDANNSPC